MLIHTVKMRDTLGKLARQYYGDAGLYSLIVAANDIRDPDRLTIGQELVIPDAAAAARALVPPPPAISAPSPLAARVVTMNEDCLRTVHPGVAARGRTMLELCARQGVGVLVTQGLRTWAEQENLYAKGRAKPPIGNKYIVTKAKGGQSYHNFGLAFDVVILDSVGKASWDTSHPGWNQAAGVGKSLGLEWGGDWTGFKDMPHFQYTGGLSLGDCRGLFPSGLQSIWDRVL
jgi:hypothetical protein